MICVTQNFIWASCAVFDNDLCMIGNIFERGFKKIKMILPEFLKGPYSSNLVNRTKNDCQTCLVEKRMTVKNGWWNKNDYQKWLMSKSAFKIC